VSPRPTKSSTSEPRPGASPDGLPPLKDVIAEHQLAAKKNLGQNFLLDLNLTRRIARVAEPLANKTVVEVGPGPGGLTRALFLEGAKRVVAIERDERCLPALEAIRNQTGGRLDVYGDDATKMDWPAFAAEISGPKVIVANLPYGVATVLLIQWLESEPWPPWYDRMVLMFQKEVGERIVAEPNTKAYGRLSVMTQWRCEARIVLTLGPQAFTPPPKVSSVVVDFRPLRQLQQTCSPKALGRVTAAAFGQRRKMLRSSLKTLTPKAEQLLEVAGISPSARGEQLTVKDFVRLATLFEKAQLD
jgi:16S rRNA (adenine1518-N6/adenine1519-N6)-dimethyltransferase